MSRIKDIEMARYLAGEMGVNEELAFLEKASRNQKQRSELINMEKHWKYYDQNPSAETWETGRAWNQLYERLESEGLLDEKPVTESFLVTRRTFLRVAATVLLVVAVGIPSLYFGVIRDSGNRLLSHKAEEGVSMVNLPDGSSVFLNQGAEISYPRAFTQQRSIQLSGEAFFEVMSDPANPFTVHSGDVAVSVLGTSFNVKQVENSAQIEVYVLSGEVLMTLQESEQSLTLEPSEIGIADKGQLSSAVMEVPNYISWKTKDFKFVDTKLTDVLRELEESYHVEIQARGADLSQMRITTSYSGQSIDAILETIGTAFGMEVSHSDDAYVLTK